MLDGLKNGLRATLKKIISSSAVDEALIKELSKDIQRALVQSDVNVKHVFEITTNIEERSLKETPRPDLSRKDHIIKIINAELANLLGKEDQFSFKSRKTNKGLMIGLQGRGKTTTPGKMS